MAWATVSEVEDISGAVVSQTELALADAVVAVYAGRTSDAAERMSDRDKSWLRMAVAFQAAKLSEEVGFLQKTAVTSLSQDGTSASFDGEWQQVLHPMAARALRNLSWKRSGSSRRIPVRATSFFSEESDAYGCWRSF